MFGALGVSSLRATSSAPVPLVDRAETAELGTVREIVFGTGTVQPQRQASLNFTSAGRVASVLVTPGSRVKAGDVLGMVDAPALAAAVADAEQGEALAAAAVASATASTAAAATQIDAATARHRAAADGPTPADSAEAVAALQQAEQLLVGANATLNDAVVRRDAAATTLRAVDTTDAESVTAATTALADATSTLSTAQQATSAAAADVEVVKAANVKRLEAPRASSVREASVGIEVARDGLAVAKRAEESARLGLVQAATATAGARAVLAETVLRAPFDGVITAVNAKEGELSTASSASTADPVTGGPTPAMVLVDDAVVRVRITMPEIDAVKVEVGSPVEVRFDALADEERNATVSSVDLTASSVNNVISYGVVIDLGDLGDVVKLGMTASVDVIVAEQSGVVRVPQSAVLDTDDGPAVLKVVEGSDEPIESPVVVGVSGDGFVEITKGLASGEKYLVDGGDSGPIDTSPGL